MSIDLKSRKFIFSAIGIAVVIVLLFGGLLFVPVNGSGRDVNIYVDADDTPDSVYAKIRNGVPDSRTSGLHIAALLTGFSEKPHTGCYVVGPKTGALRLMHNLAKGRQTPIKLTIPTARTIDDLCGKLSHVLMADSASLKKAIMQNPHHGVAEQALCIFIPNTYEVYWDITPADFIARMQREYDAFWTAERLSEANEVGLSVDEVYTMAGIVEQETANDAERPMVAGMYLNRLRQGMKLQADPTVKYALYAVNNDPKSFEIRRVTQAMCTTDSPYNTYKYEGLPIGPICIPSLASINAVLRPAHHEYMYMCAKEDFSGTHNFAVTYAEHLQNAKRYAEALNKLGIK